MRVVRSRAELHEALAPFRRGPELGLVPTMGAFHEGHLTLIRTARAENDAVVVSLFVNPAQFDEQADLAAYPGDEKQDVRLAEEAGVDVVFAPPAAEMYPEGFQTWVEVGELARGMEGAARAGHFRGVATVCLKLFNLVRPQRAYFGQKDAQQVGVVRRLVRDLDLQLAIRVLPTVRDADGLAVSSRNVRLSAEERARALTLPRALEAGAQAHRRGEDAAAAARAAFDGLAPDYVEVADLEGVLFLAAAARVGPVRLIDNLVLEGELP
jgi:pantoate--beta-alanine ligase